MASPSCVDAERQRPTDLQQDAVRLCIALQSQLNPAFLGAANELLSCAKLPPAEFRRHSRKGKWKDVYFDLLRMLQARRTDIDDSLEARANSLLIRLSSNFVGHESSTTSPTSPARNSLPEKSRRSLAMGITTCTPQPPTRSLTTCITMPPPDAFPPSAAQSFRRRQLVRPRLPFLVPEIPTRPRKRARHSTEQENKIPTPESSSTTYTYKSPPLTKRFGFFARAKLPCTSTVLGR
ncbi:hypothetical protein B0H13DRAFT_1851855 [Mycena leptocephala]|nr:hypothetical protein B0H13DRAFT_1851855 [Mycena leptocephala]